MTNRATSLLIQSPAVVGHLIVLLTAIVLLCGAWWLQLVDGLYPCPLCLLQRWPWYLGGALALLSLAWPYIVDGTAHLRSWTLLIQMGLMGWGIWLAVEHIGVEHGWWGSGCSGIGDGEGTQTIEDLLAGIEDDVGVPCDAIQWELFGITLAGYNLIITAGVLLTLAFLFYKARKAL